MDALAQLVTRGFDERDPATKPTWFCLRSQAQPAICEAALLVSPPPLEGHFNEEKHCARREAAH